MAAILRSFVRSHATVIEATLCSVQDLGRPAASWWGVATNGAPDQFSLAYANALVGNDINRPCLEAVATDLVLRFSHDTVVAVTGAHADVALDHVPAPTNQALHIRSGTTLAIRRLRNGVRAYIAILGGFQDVETFLGSVSPDQTLNFGEETVAGYELGYDRVTSTVLPRHPFGFPHLPPTSGLPGTDGHGHRPAHLSVLAGENAGMFESNAALLYTSEYHLTPKTDAVGSRLSGPTPRRLDRGEILSRALPIGAIEVSGNELLVLNRGRGLSAGYPVVGVISGPSMDTLSQLAAGDTVRFIPVTVESAVRERRRQEQELQAVSTQMGTLLASAHRESLTSTATEGWPTSGREHS